MKSTFQAPKGKSYLEGPPRMVPGYDGLLRMASILLAERTPKNGKVLVLGAGGGLELRAFADDHSGWQFAGVDPSEEMLALAQTTASTHIDRIHLHLGTIETAQEGPFDSATCLLMFHHQPLEQRLETLRQVRRRLKPGAPFVVAHMSFPQSEPDRSLWIARHVAFGLPDGTPPAHIERSQEAISTRLNIQSPADDEAMLREAGFSDVSLFYAGFSFKGWVAYA